MSFEQQISNIEKVTNGVNFEKTIYEELTKIKSIENIETQKRFYKEETTPAQEIFNILKLKKINKTQTKEINKTIEEYIDENKEKPNRSKAKYYKSADITFTTKQKYLINGKLSPIRIIIDTTTSARGDRIKAKAQDAIVYNSFKMNYIYFIVFPNNNYFDTYNNPKNEVNACTKAIYDNNFKNLYKKEKVSLIMQENDLINFLEFIEDKENQDIEILINSWKNIRYKELYEKSKIELNEYKENLFNDIMNLYSE